jgi:hypothetical protein
MSSPKTLRVCDKVSLVTETAVSQHNGNVALSLQGGPRRLSRPCRPAVLFFPPPHVVLQGHLMRAQSHASIAPTPPHASRHTPAAANTAARVEVRIPVILGLQ